MDTAAIIISVTGVIVAPSVAWFISAINSRFKSLEDAVSIISESRITILGTMVKREDFDKKMDSIEDKMDIVENIVRQTRQQNIHRNKPSGSGV